MHTVDLPVLTTQPSSRRLYVNQFAKQQRILNTSLLIVLLVLSVDF